MSDIHAVIPLYIQVMINLYKKKQRQRFKQVNDEMSKNLHRSLLYCFFFLFLLWRTSLKCTLLHRRADLQGVG